MTTATRPQSSIGPARDNGYGNLFIDSKDGRYTIGFLPAAPAAYNAEGLLTAPERKLPEVIVYHRGSHDIVVSRRFATEGEARAWGNQVWATGSLARTVR